MKTPNLDREIEIYEIHKKQGYLTKDGENYLAEFKSIKQALIIASVVKSSYCECDAPIVRTSVNMDEYCGNCGKDIEQ